MRKAWIAVPAAGAFLLSACLGPVDEGGFDLPECVMPQVDTTSWTRVVERRSYGMGEAAEVSYLVPPTFERTGPYSWERGGTRVNWEAYVAVPAEYPEMRHSDSCRATISGQRAVFDYGTMPHDPDGVVLASWRNARMVQTNGDLVFDSRMRDHSDRAVIERMFWSIVITQGGPGGS